MDTRGENKYERPIHLDAKENDLYKDKSTYVGEELATLRGYSPNNLVNK